MLEEIKIIIEKIEDKVEKKALIGELTLVTAFMEFPDMEKMEPIFKEAVDIIGGKCRTLVADEPFLFGLPFMIFTGKRPGRCKEELDAFKSIVNSYYLLTGVNSGADELLRAEQAFYRGNLEEAEYLCHRTTYLSDMKNQWTMVSGATNLMAQILFKQGKYEELIKYIKAMETSVGMDPMCSFVVEILQADYYSWLGLVGSTAEWIREGTVFSTDLPLWVKTYLRYAHMVVLLQEEKYLRLIGAAEANIIECGKYGFLMVVIYTHLIAAIACCKLGREKEAFIHVQEALAYAHKDGYFMPFKELKVYLGDLVEKAFIASGVIIPKEIISEGKKIGEKLILLSRLVNKDDTLSNGLSIREMEVARFAAKGMSNKEIATTLFISESTVKYHLKIVFSKLNISRRSQLSSLVDKKV